jgi:hypothetical protein
MKYKGAVTARRAGFKARSTRANDAMRRSSWLETSQDRSPGTAIDSIAVSGPLGRVSRRTVGSSLSLS